MQAGERITFDRYEWRVLDIQDGAALILTEEIVEQRAFHDAHTDVTWAQSEIRKYLNGAFYDRFGEAERSRILPVNNVNPDNPWYGSKGGEDTQDRVFLLSLEDAVCRYFGDSSANLQNRSAKQRYWFQKKDANNDRRKARLLESGWWWWLRTPGRSNMRAIYIHGDGNIGIQGNGTNRYNSNIIHRVTGLNTGGIRPALWLRL